MKKIFITIGFFLLASSVSASNGILSIEIPASGGLDPFNPCIPEYMEINEGETLRFLFRNGPKKNGGYQLVNRVVGHISATGLTTGYEYMGNIVAGAPALGIPEGFSSVLNVSPDGRGAGMIAVRTQFVLPEHPEVGVGVVDQMFHLIYDGDTANPRVVAEKVKVECHGGH